MLYYNDVDRTIVKPLHCRNVRSSVAVTPRSLEEIGQIKLLQQQGQGTLSQLFPHPQGIILHPVGQGEI